MLSATSMQVWAFLLCLSRAFLGCGRRETLTRLRECALGPGRLGITGCNRLRDSACLGPVGQGYLAQLSSHKAKFLWMACTPPGQVLGPTALNAGRSPCSPSVLVTLSWSSLLKIDLQSRKCPSALQFPSPLLLAPHPASVLSREAA